MPVIHQHRIYRRDLVENPGVLYLFGDNVRREGFGGQAEQMRGEPNAVGVATKWSPGYRPGDFFEDCAFQKVSLIISADLSRAFRHAKNNGIVVIPSDGLGTGLAELPRRAPSIHRYLIEALERLKAI